MRIGSVAGKNVSVTGLRELLSNFRVPEDNLKLSNSAQIWRLLYLSRIPERKLDAANKGHTQVKERGDCSSSFTIAPESYQVTNGCKHLHCGVCILTKRVFVSIPKFK
ncbi:hypothetical protein NIES267_23110 [Calothrix parasitica NIES-267]|uniref:Uncharacterized protein n=1 Tax=Calothrix parasitica NIES-267 TaxID=1973488 RepID=A0A1Z4LNL8_9CYAN|nr:hypothetical protein NIES267_23110 [Calothrix parasitica NIES-267]